MFTGRVTSLLHRSFVLLILWLPMSPLQAECAELQGDTIRWIVPNRPGGGYDAYSRLLQPFVEQSLGVTVVIENRPEAGGIIGASAIRDAKPDGKTLGLINASGLLAARAIDNPIAPDPGADYLLLARLVSNHIVMFTGRDSKVAKLQDFMQLARSRPIVVGVRDAGSTSFYSVPITADLLGFDYELVTGYVGSSARTLALIRGEVDIAIGHYDSVRGQVESGELNPLLQLTTSLNRPLDVAELVNQVDATRREDAEALGAIVGAGRLIVAPRDVSPVLSECMAASFVQILTSQELGVAAERAGLGINPVSGDVAMQQVREAQAAMPRFETLVKDAIRQARFR